MNTKQSEIWFAGEVDQSQLELLAEKLAAQLKGGELIFLYGNLGAGKTTFARALIQFLLPGVRVKSPTYTLIEHYQTQQFDLLHADLYRLADAAEIEPLGLREAIAEGNCLLIEWPERANNALGEPDVSIQLSGAGDTRTIAISRAVNGENGSSNLR